MRDINNIVVHCSATVEGAAFSVDDITRWHIERGWRTIGYHYLIELDGTLQKGREEHEIGAGVRGHNRGSIHVCYIGGIDSDKRPKDTRTYEQEVAMYNLIKDLKQRYPGAKVLGHRDFEGVNKACPCFDAIAEYSHL